MHEVQTLCLEGDFLLELVIDEADLVIEEEVEVLDLVVTVTKILGLQVGINLCLENLLVFPLPLEALLCARSVISLDTLLLTAGIVWILLINPHIHLCLSPMPMPRRLLPLLLLHLPLIGTLTLLLLTTSPMICLI